MQISESLRRRKRFFLTLLMGLLSAAAVCAAFLLRFEYAIPEGETEHLWKAACLAAGVRMLVFRLMGCDHAGWRYAGIADLHKLLIANAVGSMVWSGLAVVLIGPGFPRSIYGIDL